MSQTENTTTEVKAVKAKAPIVIQKGVPIPDRAPVTREAKYPEILGLEVGDSFAVDIGVPALANHARKAAKATGRKFIVRPEVGPGGLDLGARIWRTE